MDLQQELAAIRAWLRVQDAPYQSVVIRPSAGSEKVQWIFYGCLYAEQPSLSGLAYSGRALRFEALETALMIRYIKMWSVPEYMRLHIDERVASQQWQRALTMANRIRCPVAIAAVGLGQHSQRYCGALWVLSPAPAWMALSSLQQLAVPD